MHLRYVLPPFAIHPNPEVSEGVFARLDDHLEFELKRINAERPTELNAALRGFFEWALETIDADAYAELQIKFIEIARGTAQRNVKFLNLPHFAKSKMKHLCMIGLHQELPRRILDIGCGAGHIHLLGRYFGHEVHGIDKPLPEGHIYNVLCEFFTAKKTDHRVMAMEFLPHFDQRFDVATGILLTLRPLSAAAWKFFVEDVFSNVLAKDGRLYLDIVGGARSPEAWEFVSSIAQYTRSNRIALINSPWPNPSLRVCSMGGLATG
jgi:hypothetical protein